MIPIRTSTCANRTDAYGDAGRTTRYRPDMKRIAMMCRVAVLTGAVVVTAASATAKPPEPKASSAPDMHAIGQQLKSSPSVTLISMGLSYDDFEPIAKELYQQWRSTHQHVASLLDDEQRKKAGSVTAAANAHWWCAGVTAVSACLRSRPECDELRAKMIADGYPYSSCEPSSVAACYEYRHVMAQGSAFSCASTMANCRTARDLALASPADFQNVSECTPRE